MDFLFNIVEIVRFPPYSSLFIVFVSVIISIFSAVITNKLIDKNKLKNYTEQKRKYTEIKTSAIKTQNRKLLKYIERNEFKFNKIQKELFFMRIKPIILLSIPTIIVFIIMNGFFGGSNVIVAILSFNLWDIFQQTNIPGFILTHSYYFVPNFMTWFFLVNFLTRSLINKLVGLDTD